MTPLFVFSVARHQELLMAPARWNPPPEMDVYLQHAGDQIRCLICAKVEKVGFGGWFSRKNLKAHLENPTHVAAYDSETQKAHRDAEEHERFSEAYNTFENQDFPEINPSGPSHVTPAITKFWKTRR
ncbi:hypothetical protein DFH08DRAFT_814867 [Mycena albidolilacea]|uniref:Uncharacterized protein n=1 Tax=Mycena albidolilacea TaxID=1033008 RepID=A0AAD6ZP08_9AGAR|nr:hypothetical protein DFH08DRAFT_814867 [Mycena albidolilacea]